MKIRYEVDRDLCLVYARPTTPFSVDAMREHLRAIADDTTIQNGYCEILDLTNTTPGDVTVPELYEIVETLEKHPSRLRRMAFACKVPAMLSRLLLIQEFAKGVRIEIGVFQELVSAAAWTGVGADAIERTAVAGRD